MATLDISGALQSMVNSTTPAAMMERNMATAMFADRVHAVVEDASAKYLRAATEVKALVDNGDITPEQGQVYLEAREAQLANAKRFSSQYFS
jgi:hypothetical protein